MTRLFTIGFTKKDAKTFFGLLVDNQVRTLIDIRLNNVSQLAGFAKKDDLEFFLGKIGNISYKHVTELAPTEDILRDYRNKKITWDTLEKKFKKLLADRSPEKHLRVHDLNYSCLLCSEASAQRCHRRLVAEYLRDKLGNIEIIHL